MEQYVISLEQAKRLFDIGCQGKAEYWWVVNYLDTDAILTSSKSTIYDATTAYPAYHVGELGEMLKEYVEYVFYTNGEWCVILETLGITEFLKYPTEAIARGAKLIDLIENEKLNYPI